jgi:hypothetical protein
MKQRLWFRITRPFGSIRWPSPWGWGFSLTILKVDSGPHFFNVIIFNTAFTVWTIDPDTPLPQPQQVGGFTPATK